MATIKLQGNASGSGTVILTAPNTNSTRTITLPDQDVDLGGAGSIKAWVNFTAYSSFSLRGGGNVSSVTDNGTGNFQVNFSNSLSTSNYAGIVTAGSDGTSYADADDDIDHIAVMGQMNTSNLYAFCGDMDNGVPDDPQYMGVMVSL